MASRDEQILDLSNPTQKKLLIEFIKSRDGLHWIDIRRCRDQRSLNQNAYLWGVVYPRVARSMSELWGERIDNYDVHEFLKDKFLKRPMIDRRSGEVVGYTVPSSASLDTAEFGEYLDQIIKFAGEYLSIDIPLAMRMAEVTA